jgi:hypothetical protein
MMKHNTVGVGPYVLEHSAILPTFNAHQAGQNVPHEKIPYNSSNSALEQSHMYQFGSREIRQFNSAPPPRAVMA